MIPLHPIHTQDANTQRSRPATKRLKHQAVDQSVGYVQSVGELEAESNTFSIINTVHYN